MRIAVLALTVGSAGGCIAAAAGGVGAGMYYSDRGATSLIATPLDNAYGATRATFTDMGITETKTSTEQEGASSQREIKGTMTDRDVTVTLKTEGTGTRVEVVASKSAVTWDKDLAKKILEKIVDHAK
ncbi:MAG: DUF3568 family protein [Gemmatimonadota bacterium]